MEIRMIMKTTYERPILRIWTGPDPWSKMRSPVVKIWCWQLWFSSCQLSTERYWRCRPSFLSTYATVPFSCNQTWLKILNAASSRFIALEPPTGSLSGQHRPHCRRQGEHPENSEGDDNPINIHVATFNGWCRTRPQLESPVCSVDGVHVYRWWDGKLEMSFYWGVSWCFNIKGSIYLYALFSVIFFDLAVHDVVPSFRVPIAQRPNSGQIQDLTPPVGLQGVWSYNLQAYLEQTFLPRDAIFKIMQKNTAVMLRISWDSGP